MKKYSNRGMHYAVTAILVLVMGMFMMACEEDSITKQEDTGLGIDSGTGSSSGITPSTSCSIVAASAEEVDPVFAGILRAKKIPTVAELENASRTTKQIFIPYRSLGGKTLEVVYISPQGAGTKDGTSWTNAKAGDGGELKSVIEGIKDASADKIYMLLLSTGNYKPNANLSMKDHVAIVGGWEVANGIGSLARKTNKKTEMDGNKSIRIFNNSAIGSTALLYGVDIIHGKAEGPAGGVISNFNSSPTFIQVNFSDNEGDAFGGGMINSASSPLLIQVSFFSNSAHRPTGGGMHNINSSPTLIQVGFFYNSVSYFGGGMYNSSSSPTLIHTVFFENRVQFANRGTAGMFNDGNNDVTIVNSIFWDNFTDATNNYGGKASFSNKEDSNALSVYNSIVAGGLNEGVVGSKTNVVFNSVGEANPKLLKGAIGSSVTQGIAIQKDSPAINAGLYVKASPDYKKFYYSEDNITWYDSLTKDGPGSVNGAAITPPADSIDINATDIAGNPRVGKPDIGLWECQ